MWLKFWQTRFHLALVTGRVYARDPEIPFNEMSIPATWVLVWKLSRYCQTGFTLAIVFPTLFWGQTAKADLWVDRRRRLQGKDERERKKGKERERERQQTRYGNISQTCLVGLNNANCNYRKQREFVSVVTPLLSEEWLKRNEVTSVGFENIPFEALSLSFTKWSARILYQVFSRRRLTSLELGSV